MFMKQSKKKKKKKKRDRKRHTPKTSFIAEVAFQCIKF